MPPPQTPACAGFVLAGGRSSRMGCEKALLELNGTPLLVRAARVLASVCGSATIVGSPESYARFGFPTIADEQPHLGPLGGILTALDHSKVSWNLVVACDLPYLTAEWLRYLIGRAASSHARVILPESAFGPEPLCAVYHREVAPAIRAQIDQGERKVTRALAAFSVERIPPADIAPFDPCSVLFHN